MARTTEIAPGVTLENKPISEITSNDLEALRIARLAAAKALCATTERRNAKHGEVGANRLLGRLRHFFTWAIKRRYITESPFRLSHHVIVVEMNGDAETPRDRRLIGDEETRLVTAAGPHLRALIEAALTTGARKAELLSMQWWQVREARSEIFIAAPKTKTDRSRTVPLVPRLKAVLAMPKQDADGQPFGPNAFVFGNECGEHVKSIKTAWSLTCQRAKITDLHFHDLRRECGSRWHEAGVSLVQIQAWLGHTNIAQTSTYLGVSLTGTEDAKRLLETANAFNTVESRVWQAMLARCENPQAIEYADHGARGIQVCERWHVLENFLADMGRCPSDTAALVRIDTNGHYEPGNCRWATPTEHDQHVPEHGFAQSSHTPTDDRTEAQAKQTVM